MKTLGNIDTSISSSFTLSNGVSFVTITAPPTGIYIISLPPDLGLSGQVLTTNGAGQTYWSPGPTNYITSVDTDFEVTLGELSLSPLFNSRAITLTVPSFLSVVGSPVTGAAGTFTIGLGSDALPLSNGGTGLTAIGPVGTVLSSNGVSAIWIPAGAATNYITSVNAEFQVVVGQLSFSSAFQTAFDVLLLDVVDLNDAVDTQTIQIGNILSSQITLATPSFLSVTGSPVTGASGALTIGLGAGALPLENGGTGLTAIGPSGTVLSSNGVSALWIPAGAATNFITAVTGDFLVTTGILSFSPAFIAKEITLAVPSFLSVSGSPVTGGAGAFTISLGTDALPIANGYSYSLTHIGKYLRR